jgi:phenylacetate-coenzyme A ligase PaaK-like adenylate-forming protein
LNVEWISSCPAPVRIAGYFGLQRLIGSEIFRTWREWQKWDRFTTAQLDMAVEARLSALLAKATRESEHYRKLGLVRAAKESAEQFLARFPILGREQVRSCFAQIVTDSFRNDITSPASRSRKRYDWLVIKTGGTTGVPTAVVHDATFRDWGRASRLYSQQLCGIPFRHALFPVVGFGTGTNGPGGKA